MYNTNLREIADSLLEEVEQVDICQGMTIELVERTAAFQELFLMGLSAESFTDELLNISAQQFNDLSKVFFNIREYIKKTQSKEEFVATLEGDVNKHLTLGGISLIETSIRRQEEESSRTNDAIDLGASQFYL